MTLVTASTAPQLCLCTGVASPLRGWKLYHPRLPSQHRVQGLAFYAVRVDAVE